jgi:putative ABC transport system permease protein
MMDTLLQDLRYAGRSLLKNPAFTAVAIFTLALGIGANTALFSVVNAVLLRPLSYVRPDGLVALSVTVDGREVGASMPQYQDFRRGVPALQDLAAAWLISTNLTGSGKPERVQAVAASPNYFAVLGMTPQLGRGLNQADAGDKLGYVAVISYDLWRRRFGGDSGVIGRTIRLDDDPMTIIGVTPPGFRHPAESGQLPVDEWGAINLDNPDTAYINNRQWQVFNLIGRLRPGATVEQAQAQVDVVQQRGAALFPDIYPVAARWRADVIPLAEQMVGDVRPALLILLGAVGFVLIIACANVANLLLARATARDREIAIRTALGGGRRRIIRQLLTESLLLSSVGGVLGLLLAAWAIEVLAHLATQYLPRAQEIDLDYTVLGFTAGLIVFTGLGFGLVPAIQASKADLHGVLKDAGRGSTAGRTRGRTRGALVVMQVAVALVLLTGAGLLLRSFQQLMAVDPGFDTKNLLTLQLWLSWPNQPEKGKYFTHEQRLTFYERVLAAIGAIPSVRSVGLTSRLPLRGSEAGPLAIEGRPARPDEAAPSPEGRLVSPSYFETMGIPLVQGRGLSTTGDAKAPAEVLINRVMAQKYWPNSDPIGRRIRFDIPDWPWSTIVGIVGDVRQIGIDTPAREEAYFSYRWRAGQEMAVVVRTSGSPERLSAAVTRAIHSVDPEQPVFATMPMTRVISEVSAERRYSMLLLVLFAGVALLLSAIGIYGVMAYTTTQRRPEIGIRMALGAGSSDVLGLVVGQGMRLVLIGLVIGLAGAWTLSRVLASQLYEVTNRDPITYVGVAALLGIVALAATYLPARRALQVDPMISLRSE